MWRKNFHILWVRGRENVLFYIIPTSPPVKIYLREGVGSENQNSKIYKMS